MTIILLSVSFCVVSQDVSPKPPVSGEQLTTEQIVVYRVVLKDYLNGSDGALNLANMTEPFDQLSESMFERHEIGARNNPANDPQA